MPRRPSAFSLVELAIVLVILGLLVGGITGGQALIHSSQLRAVTTEYMRFIAAEQSFHDRFQAIPGDYEDATGRWGQSTLCGGTVSTGTCNGNGNGSVDPASAASSTGEAFQFWRQLVLAGLIEGSYNGIAGSGGAYDSDPGVNVPGSKYPNGVWSITYEGVIPSGSATSYASVDDNMLYIGATDANTLPINSLFPPMDAYSIDKKIDDGMPGTGLLLANDIVGFGNANSCTTSANSTDYSGTYNLSSMVPACMSLWIRAF
jgi:prepilin-type N-terminal cleavage/methylation domain-containing protein